MHKLNKARRAIAMTAATLTVAVGATITDAGSAGATIGCSGGDGCSHQTTIYMDGRSYSPTHEWWGPFTVLKMQSDGNLVLYCQGQGSSQAKWATGTAYNRAFPYVLFEGGSGGGSMVVYDSVLINTPNGSYFQNQAEWSSLTKPPTHSTSGTEAIVQADGNFVIYDAYGNALWSSNTYHACPGTGGYWG
ncbi:hypothetical protein [Streptomyces sp. NPDC007205]|uniref:hypothetical protein n=1 Tax=Streptomyces sp. NPDC007205 TaxID=3154316 RepID=UPI0033E59200